MALSRIVAFSLCLLGLVTAADAATRTHQLSNRPADDVAQQLKELYPRDQAAITSHGQQLIIRADDSILDEIDQLIDTMDVAVAQLRITIRSGGNDHRHGSGAGASARDNQITLNAGSRTISTERQREQSLVILDGQSAHINSGQVRALPVAIQGGRNPAVLYQQVPMRRGFVVTPRLISRQQVELSVMAFDDLPQDDQPGFETEAVMTSRRVAPGTWVELGSTETTRKHQQQGIVYQVGGDSRDQQRFEVRVDVL
ncbi:secretin [Marinobacter xestospongiae]|uniref:Secretin n=1 Tax=Marinobacter xestospongiae TaxID=994319 RepID=A0ABU3VW32_9GAMM|nr:secretin [Marinobacter xestospongiae]MDV2078495.1 secretin [Marinobacter xestospongiae]